MSFLVLILFENFSQVARSTLQQDEEEEVLGEADCSITICVDLLEDIGLMILEILVLILEVRRVVVRRHRMQKVFVRHSELAVLCLLAGKDFERLLRRGEKSNLVLVVSADFLCPWCVKALTNLAILLLLRHVERQSERGEQEHRRAILFVLMPLVVARVELSLLKRRTALVVSRLDGSQGCVESLDALLCLSHIKSVSKKNALSAPLHSERHHYFYQIY